MDRILMAERERLQRAFYSWPCMARPYIRYLEQAKLAIGGEGGIRTLDTAFQPYNGLANRRLQPLGHLSDQDYSVVITGKFRFYQPGTCPKSMILCPKLKPKPFWGSIWRGMPGQIHSKTLQFIPGEIRA
jgi:hypothetical protein